MIEARLDEASRELAGMSPGGVPGRSSSLEHSVLALRGSETRIANGALVAIERSQERLITRAQRLAGPASQRLAVQAQRVAHQREILQLLDPQRQLERGWSLTRDESGTIVRSSASAAPWREADDDLRRGKRSLFSRGDPRSGCARSARGGAR